MERELQRGLESMDGRRMVAYRFATGILIEDLSVGEFSDVSHTHGVPFLGLRTSTGFRVFNHNTSSDGPLGGSLGFLLLCTLRNRLDRFFLSMLFFLVLFIFSPLRGVYSDSFALICLQLFVLLLGWALRVSSIGLAGAFLLNGLVIFDLFKATM